MPAPAQALDDFKLWKELGDFLRRSARAPAAADDLGAGWPYVSPETSVWVGQSERHETARTKGP